MFKITMFYIKINVNIYKTRKNVNIYQGKFKYI